MSSFIRLPWIFAGPPAAARSSLAALLKLEPSAQTTIVDAVKSLGPPYSRKRMTEKARQLHEQLKVLDADALFGIMDVVSDLIGLPPGNLRDVLAEMFKDTGIQFSNLEELIKSATSDPEFIKSQEIQQFTRLALPTLFGFEHFCAIRARFDKDFRYNEDKIEKYEPKVVDQHPVVVLRLSLNDSDRNVAFQLDQERLDKLITELIAAQKQLKLIADNWARARNEKSSGGRKEKGNEGGS